MKKSGRATLISTALAAVVLAGCGEPPVKTPEAASTSLFLRTAQGVSVIEPGAGEPSYTGRNSVPSRDWSTVVKAQYTKQGTVVTSFDPSSGAEHWSHTVPGEDLRVKIVSDAGDVVAMGPQAERLYQFGRRNTSLTIVRGNSTEVQEIKLEGNYEPEAFSTDGQSLFVVKYLPARAPTKYQVRRLDLNTETVEGVYTPHEELQRAMGGTARIQAGSPDGDRLYTLYTLGRGANSYAFIHVLSLDKLWAHCIDLPSEFAQAAESATALTVSPDGNRLYVANAAAGILAEIDTEALTVERTTPMDFGKGRNTHASSDSDSKLFFASGNQVTSVDAKGLTKTDSWLLEARVTGLQESADLTELYVGLDEDVAVLDPETGTTVDTIDPPGVNRINQLGPEPPPLEEIVSKDLTCAC